MYENKRVLLIAGGGTLGTHVANELLSQGATVEIICPEEKHSDCERRIFHRNYASEKLLKELFAKKHYDGIVNFIHYENPEDYKAIHPLLIENTDHLIFLSSYRVYADVQHPITEAAPRLTEVVKDEDFLRNEKYAVPKARCEDYLRNERKGDPFTIVRPVISFSERRFDLLMYSGDRILQAARTGEVLLMPETVKDFTAGLDWAGNSGRLIANLLFKKEALGETFTIYSGHGLTWGEIASLYERITGVKFRWCPEREYLDSGAADLFCAAREWQWIYDRKYNRDIDASRVLKVTGLSAKDLTAIEDGIRYELQKYNEGHQ